MINDHQESFFTRDKNFYRTFFRLMLVVALQNLVAYSVNMLDNMMPWSENLPDVCKKAP